MRTKTAPRRKLKSNKPRATNGATQAVKKSAASRPADKFVFRLYVAGDTARSQGAILRARQLCKTEMKGNFKLIVIDIYKHPILARNGQILATPTLVKECPLPVRRLIGNLTNITGLCVGLDVDGSDKSAV
jgi:circadian clock protein KaiB